MSKLPLQEPSVPREPPRPRGPQPGAPKTSSSAALPRWVAWAPSVESLDKAAKVRCGLSPQTLEHLRAAGLPVPVKRSQAELAPAPGQEVQELDASPLYDIAVAATPGLILPATGALLAILTPMVGALALVVAVALTLVGMAWAAKRTFALLALRSKRREALRLSLTQQPLSPALERLQRLQLRLDQGDLPVAAQADLQASVWGLWEALQQAASTADLQDDQQLLADLSTVEDTLAQTAPAPDTTRLQAQAQAASAARRETP